MMKRAGLLLVAAALVVPAVATSAGATTRDVAIGPGNTYVPATKTIEVGDTVRWTHKDGSTEHSVTSNPGSTETFDSSPNNCPDTNPLEPTGCMTQSSPPFTHTFDAVGDFGYFCKIHGTAMSGTIRVVSKASQSQSPTHSGSPRPSKSASASASASGSPSASASPSVTTSGTGEPSPSPSATVAEPPTGGGGGSGGKIAVAVLGVLALGGAGFLVWRRFLAG